MSAPVVVGYTATKAGRDALALGARLAQASGADLHSVIVLPADTRSVITPPKSGYDRYLQDQADAWLADAVADLPDGLAHTEHVRFADSFGEGLLQAAHDVGAGHLVVGGADGSVRGRHRVGTTAAELVHTADVPVVLVPRGARKTPLDAGIPRITVALGTRPGADEVMAEAVRLATATGARVRLVSLVTVDLPATVDTGVIRVAGAAHAQDVLARAQSSLPDGIESRVVVGDGESIEEAVAALDWEPGEIVLVGSSRLAQPKRLFLGSTATKMLRELPVPMMVVPRSRAAEGGDPS